MLMQYTKKMGQRDSWMKDYQVYVPILRQLTIILKAAILQMIFPQDDNYVRIEVEGKAGEFLTEAVLLNMHKTAWATNADVSVFNTLTFGNGWNLAQQKGLFTEIIPFGVDTTVCSPLDNDLSQTTIVSILRRRLDKLISSEIPYFNLEHIAAKYGGKATFNAENPDYRQKDADTLGRGSSVTLGEGHLLYQAYMHQMEFRDGSIIYDHIATYADDFSTLIRFEPQAPGFNPWFLSKYGTNLSGQFWSLGPVQQGLSINGYLNTLMMITLVQDVLDAIGVYGYRESDGTIEAQVNRNELVIQPNAFWKLGRDGEIIPIQRISKTGSIKELFFILKNELVDLLNAHIFFSGNTPDGKSDPTATFTRARERGADIRRGDIGRIFDEGLIKPAIYRVLKGIQATFWNRGSIIDPNTGQPARQKQININAIQDWLEMMKWDINSWQEPGFLENITADINEDQIKVTGTQAFAEKERVRTDLITVTQLVSTNPMFQPYIKPDKLLRKIIAALDIKDLDDITFTIEEELQMLQENLDAVNELLADPVDDSQPDPTTGQSRALTPEETNTLLMDKQDIETKINQLTGRMQSDMMNMAQMLTGVVPDTDAVNAIPPGEQRQAALV